MAYKTKELHDKALAAIEKHKLFFIEDVVAFLPCSKPTFYEHKLNESADIKAALERNVIEVKTSLRSKWYKSSAPALQLALYKIIADDVERRKLSMTHTDITSGGEKLPTIIIESTYGRKPKFRTDNSHAQIDDVAANSSDSPS